MADRIVVLRDGKVEQIGTPVELYDRPGNAFVATFIGSPSMNLLPATVQGGSAGTLGGAVPLPAQQQNMEGRKVLLGLRPEHLKVQTAGTPGMACEVKVVEFSGADTLLACESHGQAVQALVHDRLLVKPGDAISLGIAPELVHLFDAGTQQRI